MARGRDYVTLTEEPRLAPRVLDHVMCSGHPATAGTAVQEIRVACPSKYHDSIGGTLHRICRRICLSAVPRQERLDLSSALRGRSALR